MALASHCASCGAPLTTGMQCSRSCHVTRGLVAPPRLVPVSSIKWSSDGEWISRLEADVARLTHRVAQLEAQFAEARAAVARLTTERDKFQEWFQNAEQARAVAESKLASRSVTRCQKCGAEALPSPTHALDLEAERDDARAAVEHLTTEKAQYDADLAAAAGELLVPIPEAGTDAARMLIANRLLKSQLAEAKRVREQAIQDIEALPTFRVGKAGGLPEAVSRSAVLSIVRGSATP